MEQKVIRILQIEDNPGDARLVREMLKGTDAANYAIVQVETLTRGIEIVFGGAVDIILLDLGLPESTGIATLRKLLSCGVAAVPASRDGAADAPEPEMRQG